MENDGRSGNVGEIETGQRISREFDWRETQPSVAVIRLLSVAMNCDPTAIEPIWKSVDPDALDRLLPSTDEGTKIEFRHRHLSVLLYGDGRAAVEPEGR